MLIRWITGHQHDIIVLMYREEEVVRGNLKGQKRFRMFSQIIHREELDVRRLVVHFRLDGVLRRMRGWGNVVRAERVAVL